MQEEIIILQNFYQKKKRIERNKKISICQKKVDRTNRFKERTLFKCQNEKCNVTWLALKSQNTKKYCKDCLLDYLSDLMKGYHKKGIINVKGKNNPHFGISNFGQKRTEEQKRKMRISAIKHIEKFRGPLKANVGKHEKELLDQQEINNNCKIQRQYHIKELGYCVDGYDKKNNIIYEVYEKKHLGQLEKDLKRQQQIQNYLNCDFKIIWDK